MWFILWPHHKCHTVRKPVSALSALGCLKFAEKKKMVAHLKFEMLAKTREKYPHSKKTKDKFEAPLKHTTAIMCVRIVNSVETTCLRDHDVSNE